MTSSSARQDDWNTSIGDDFGNGARKRDADVDDRWSSVELRTGPAERTLAGLHRRSLGGRRRARAECGRAGTALWFSRVRHAAAASTCTARYAVSDPLPLREGTVRVPPEEGRLLGTRRGEVRAPLPPPTAGVTSVTPKTAPGTILETPSRLIIATGDNPLEIIELQPAGKRSMPAAEFLRGHRFRVGDSFGPA